MTNQREENNKLLESFLERTFFKGWRNPDVRENVNFRSMEIFFNTKCNLACEYCYLNNYGNQLYPPKLQDDKLLLNNLEMLLDWLIENNFAPNQLEYFSGEPLVQEAGLRGLEIILEKFQKAARKPDYICVPTNLTFLLYDDLTERVEALLRRSRAIGCPIFLSGSFDGKYCEANRSFRNKREMRDDIYYDKAFAFVKKWGGGFHPMIYSNLIESWKKNFLWFQENFKKYNLPWDAIYLLEVRNAEWTDKQTNELGDFIEFVIDWTFEKCDMDRDKFTNFVFKGGYNLLMSPMTTCGRGLSCSIQSMMTVRIGDLSWVPCHRTSYDSFILANFKTKDNKIIGLESYNPELMLTVFSHDARNQPWCTSCLIKPLCTFGCLGSQFETHGDLFTPIPTVCQMHHVKIASMVRGYKKVGVFDMILDKITPEKAFALRKVEEIMKQGQPSSLAKQQITKS